MKRVFLSFGFMAAALVLQANPAEHPNAWRPEFTVIEPYCQVTDWNQSGPLNTYVTPYVCGCDPLAWGQVIAYHALNHGFPAKDWIPESYTGTVFLKNDGINTRVERTTKSGRYDWVAIRDKTTWADEVDSTVSPVGRLMWDLGVMGGTQYGGDFGTAGTVWPRFAKDYFKYAGVGYVYGCPRPNAEVQPYWREMLRRILRTSLQAQAPLGTSITAHMIVADGYGVDAQGEEWFHFDYGWGSGSGKWWNLDKAFATIVALYPNVHPTHLGSVVAGRVADGAHAGIVGAVVTLNSETVTRTLTTDATGSYCFTGLSLDSTAALRPEDLSRTSYTVTVAAQGYVSASQTVVTAPFIDDQLRAKKQDAYENAFGKSEFYYYPHVFGNTVADFTLRADVVYVTANASASGDGTSWASAAPFSQATLDAAKGRIIRLAKGNYTFVSQLTVPAGTTLLGGYDPESELCDPAAFSTVLRFVGNANLSEKHLILLGGKSVLNGLRIVGNAAGVSCLLMGPAERNATVRNCILSGTQALAAINLRVETSLVSSAGMGWESCTLLHCSFVGSVKQSNCTDLGGHRANVGADGFRPLSAQPCAAEHSCPETGFDGRPLGKTAGALAPDRFDLSSAGYLLHVQ